MESAMYETQRETIQKYYVTYNTQWTGYIFFPCYEAIETIKVFD